MPKPTETAHLYVNGMIFKDWKSVTVYLSEDEAYNYYRFTTTEGRALAKNFLGLQIRPGMYSKVNLGGAVAVDGPVVTRQVAYNATQHGIEITGKTNTFQTVSGAAQTKGGELRNVSFEKLATKVLEPFGLKFTPKGGINGDPFDRVNMTGQTAWEVLEPHARARNIVLGTDPDNGSVMVGATPRYTEGTASVTEGVNILEGREILSLENGTGAYMNDAQFPPKPDQWGAVPTHGAFGNLMSGFGKEMGGSFYMPLVNHLEVPGLQKDAQQRSEAEGNKQSGEQAKVEIVTRGWFTPQGGLWRPKMMVHVKSPMLILDEDMKLRSVTFTQDDKTGTRSTLELLRYGQIGPDLSAGQ